jgi:hypothetical protein
VQTEAKCNCGKRYDYIPAGKAAKLAIAAHPNWSDYKLAEMVGVGKDTIRRAREPGSANAPPEQRIGRNGRQQAGRKQSKMPRRDAEPPAATPSPPKGHPAARPARAFGSGATMEVKLDVTDEGPLLPPSI